MYHPPHRTPGIELTFWQRMYYYWCYKNKMSPELVTVYGSRGSRTTMHVYR